MKTTQQQSPDKATSSPVPAKETDGQERQVAPPADHRSQVPFSLAAFNVHRGGANPVQAKLRLNESGDEFEREADAVSEQIVNDKEEVSINGRVPRKAGMNSSVLRRKDNGGPAAISDQLETYVERLSGRGRPMNRQERNYFEPRFGVDFSQVRMHFDSTGADTARDINANAYTFGNHIVFAGDVNMRSRESRKLVAHELTHVVQQRSGHNRSVIARDGNNQLSAPETMLKVLKEKPADEKGPEYQAWKKKLKDTFNGFTQKDQQVLQQRMADTSKDGLAVYFRQVMPDADFRKELLKIPDAAPTGKGPDEDLIKNGQFKELLFSLNGMPMDYMLKRIDKIATASLQRLAFNLKDADPLGEKSVKRLGAALLAVGMKRDGVTVAGLDALDELMDAAALPNEQRDFIKKILPALPGGNAARIADYFSLMGSFGGEAKKMVETTVTFKSFKLLARLPDAELRITLLRILKPQLEALMMHSRQTDAFGDLPAERIKQAMLFAWQDRFPLEPARFDTGSQANPVSKLTTMQKWLEATKRAGDKLGGELQERIKELFTAESIAMMIVLTAAFVFAQTTPIGWLADIVMGALFVITVAMVGSEAITIVKLLMVFFDKATNATTEKDLDDAGQALATALTKAGIDIIMAILFHKAGKAANLRPSGPRSPGLVEVIQVKGGRVMRALSEVQSTEFTLQTVDGPPMKFTSFPDLGPLFKALKAPVESPKAGGGPGLKTGVGGGGKAPAPKPKATPAKTAPPKTAPAKVAPKPVPEEVPLRPNELEKTPPGEKPLPEAPGKDVKAPGKEVDTPGKKVDTPGKEADTPGKKVETPGKEAEAPAKEADPTKAGADKAAPKPAEPAPAAPKTAAEPAPAETKPAGKGKAEEGAPREKTAKELKAEEKAAATEASVKKYAAKVKEIKEAQDTRNYISNEIYEARQSLKDLPPEERPAVLKEIQENLVELKKQEAYVKELASKLGEIDLSPYEKARGYSFSAEAERGVYKRAAGVDEMSKLPVKEPSIDHIVPIEEIVRMEGFDKLSPEAQWQVLSYLENLRMMEKVNNSSKGSKSWLGWEAGKRIYGEVTWRKMVTEEVALRGKLQALINSLKSTR